MLGDIEKRLERERRSQLKREDSAGVTLGDRNAEVSSDCIQKLLMASLVLVLLLYSIQHIYY